MKTQEKAKHNEKKQADKDNIRSIEQAFREPAPPLSKTQHIISGVAIVIALIILSVVAASVINWQKQQSSNDQSTSETTVDIEDVDNSDIETDADGIQGSNKFIRGSVEAVLPVSLARENEILVGIDDPIIILNPIYSSGDGEKDLVSLLFESLVTINDDGRPMPELASSWQFDANSKSLIFTIAAGHYFRDGRAVDAEDVIFTYNCLISETYNGPYKGRFSEIISIGIGPSEDSVMFSFSDKVSEPDFAMFTIGIMKRDHYSEAANKVFMMFDEKMSPEGSGNFELDTLNEDKASVSLRAGYAGNIRSIVFEKISSEDKFSLLQEGKLDIVRSRWDTRMIIRSESLPAYSFYPSDSRIESYVIVGRNISDTSALQSSDHRYAALKAVAGLEISESQAELLREVDQPLTWYYFKGVDELVTNKNLQEVNLLASRLIQFGIVVEPKPLDWPEMAAMLEMESTYDIMLMPAPSNNRLPQGTIMLTQTQSFNKTTNANAWPAQISSEAIIINSRILQATIETKIFPLTSSTAGWTKRLENIRFYDPSINGGPDNEQASFSE